MIIKHAKRVTKKEQQQVEQIHQEMLEDGYTIELADCAIYRVGGYIGIGPGEGGMVWTAFDSYYID